MNNTRRTADLSINRVATRAVARTVASAFASLAMLLACAGACRATVQATVFVAIMTRTPAGDPLSVFEHVPNSVDSPPGSALKVAVWTTQWWKLGWWFTARPILGRIESANLT
ncbi:MAG TPA: hypothetical protein VKT77_12540, partial [Chthonomonadaceae bacterium]|nr:hypothetical protein [Chthonomonadaceae bacterium]